MDFDGYLCVGKSTSTPIWPRCTLPAGSSLGVQPYQNRLLVSLDQVRQDKKANFDRCFSIIADAKSSGCELVFFPEMTLTGYSLNMSADAESEDQSVTLNWFQEAHLPLVRHLFLEPAFAMRRQEDHEIRFV